MPSIMGAGAFVMSEFLNIRPREQGRNSGALLVAESIGTSVMTALTGACYAVLLAEGVPAFGWIFLMLLAASVLAIATSLRIGPVHDIAG